MWGFIWFWISFVEAYKETPKTSTHWLIGDSKLCSLLYWVFFPYAFTPAVLILNSPSKGFASAKIELAQKWVTSTCDDASFLYEFVCFPNKSSLNFSSWEALLLELPQVLSLLATSNKPLFCLCLLAGTYPDVMQLHLYPHVHICSFWNFSFFAPIVIYLIIIVDLMWLCLFIPA